MVAPRKTSISPDAPVLSAVPYPADPPSLLARQWAALAVEGADLGVMVRLCTELRALVAVLGSEPFLPATARDLGGRLLATGLFGDPHAPNATAAEELDAGLALLRREAAALGVTGPSGARRLDEVLAAMAEGFAAELRHLGAGTVPGRASSGVITDRHYRALFEQAGVGIGFADLRGNIVAANAALLRMTGSTGLRHPRPLSDFVHPDDLTDIFGRFRRLVRSESESLRIEMRLVRPDSEIIWVHTVVTLARHPDGSPSHLMVVVEDTSERQRVRSRLQHASARDQLTRLPGQAVVDQWLHRAFAPDGLTRVGICSLDIDGFQAVNDSLGDDVGDRLLLAVAGRLQLAAGEHVVTRTGSDEFTVLVADPDGVAGVCRVADRLQDATVSPFVIDGRELVVTVSIGVAEGSTARSCLREMTRAADVARSWAKAMGGGRRMVYDHQRDSGEATRLSLLRGLRGGIGREEFRLVYQPLVDLATGRLRAVEALVRWQHPEQGLIGPGRFIGLAEHSGAIIPLGRWVLETACRQAAHWWRELGVGAPYVSVNVSPVQLAQPSWLGEVTSALRESGLPPAQLQLEITEQAVLGYEASALDALAALRAAGVRLALDDFGTGYSSLVWLRKLPVHALKIDGSFIEGLRHADPDPVDASIVRATIDMAHGLGLEVTAEWVETSAQSERLAAMGCDFGQGHWFGDAGPGEWVPGLWRRSIRR